MQDFDADPRPWVRAAGLMYLAIIALGMFGELVVRGSLVVAGDAAATLAHLHGSETLWRAGIAADMLMHVLDVPVIVVLYLLLRPVSPTLALLATAFNLVQTAVLVANKSTLVVPLLLRDQGPVSVQVAGTWIALHTHGFAIGLVFFGIACVLRGVLILRCDFLPRWIGALLVLAGAAYLVNSAALLLAGGFGGTTAILVLLPALAGELALALRLTFRGVDVARWRASVAT